MSLKEIRLTPTTPATPVAAADPVVAAISGGGAPPDNLAKLKDTYAQRVKAVAQPINDAYFAQLTNLEQSLTKQQDTEGLAALAQERTRVSKWLENPTSPLPSHSGAFRSALVSAGLAVLADDARLLPDATNSGDQFRVSQDGKDITVRLLWVTCPPRRADDKNSLDYYAKYFAISPDDTTAVGKEAADFTAGMLEDKPLRILSNGQRDPDGRTYAVVVPEGMDDLASMLVDNGLAAVTPVSSNKKPRRYESSVFESLKERENGAKQRPIPIGAWGYVANPAPPSP